MKRRGFPFVWIYLKMFGQITESLCNQLFWIFSEEEFKNALACFMLNYNDKHDEINDLIEAIKMRFNKVLQADYNGTINEWAIELFSKVKRGNKNKLGILEPSKTYYRFILHINA